MCQTHKALTYYDCNVSTCYEFAKNSILLRLPEEGQVFFNRFQNQLERPFVVYADTECSLVKADEPSVLRKHWSQFCMCLYVIMLRR